MSVITNFNKNIIKIRNICSIRNGSTDKTGINTLTHLIRKMDYAMPITKSVICCNIATTVTVVQYFLLEPSPN